MCKTYTADTVALPVILTLVVGVVTVFVLWLLVIFQSLNGQVAVSVAV